MNVELLLANNGLKQQGSKNGYTGRPIAETILNGFFIVDQKWTVTYWNKAAGILLGVEAKDIIGKNFWEEFAGIIPIDFYIVYHKAFLQDKPVHFEEYWAEMGTWFDVITYHCDDTLCVSFKSFNQPIPPLEPEQTQDPAKQLKIVNELYRLVTEITNDCLWDWDLENKEMFWIDGGHKRVFGYQIENALIPQSFWESRLHPDDKARLLKRLNKIFSEGTVILWEEEYRFLKADGNYAYVHDRGHIIYDENKKATRVIGASQDITARKLTEMELLESEKKLALIARQASNALLITDADEHITWVNKAFTRITDYRPEEVIGRKLGSFLQGKETDTTKLQYLRQKIRAKQPFDCEILNYSKSGRKYWMHVQGQPLVDEQGNGNGYFTIETEITRAVLTAQENEREVIGKELHDNLGQLLAVANMYLQMGKTSEENRAMHLDKSSELIVNVIKQIRQIAKNLVIPGTEIIGLFDNIKNLIKDLTLVNPLKIEFHAEEINEKDINDMLQVTIFRIVQEQFNNIIKHANATNAILRLSRQDNRIRVHIFDDGDGCDLSKEKTGVGIINIRSRAELSQGSVTILSKPGEGYELNVLLSMDGHE